MACLRRAIAFAILETAPGNWSSVVLLPSSTLSNDIGLAERRSTYVAQRSYVQSKRSPAEERSRMLHVELTDEKTFCENSTEEGNVFLRPLDVDEALYLAAEAGVVTRKELQKRIITSPSFSPGQAPFLLNNMFTPTESATHTTIKPKSKNKLPSTCTPWTESLSTVSTTHECAKHNMIDAVTSAISKRDWGSKNSSFEHNKHDFFQESEGRGTCRRAVAHVRLVRGTGMIRISRPGPFIEQFPHHYSRAAILRPFLVTKTCGLYDAYIDCVGGGTSGKASAMRLAIARALVQANPATATVLQKELLLHEDVRQRWPKVPRRRGARRGLPFRKR